MFQYIKNFLKRILPPPVRTFNREIERILTAIRIQGDSFQVKLDEHCRKEAEQWNQVRAEQEKRSDELTLHIRTAQTEIIDNITHQLHASLEEMVRIFAKELSATSASLTENLTKELRERQAESTAALTEALCTIREDLNINLTAQQKHQDAQSAQILQLTGKVEQVAIQQKEQKVIEEKCESGIHDLMRQGVNRLEEVQKQLQRDINTVKQVVPNKPIYWTNGFERKVVQENWGDVCAQPDFGEKFLKLTAGMDAESIRKIVRILSRQSKYLNSPNRDLDLFTRAEQEEIRLLRENFNAEILKLSDNLFAYRNYLLPLNQFEASVFYYKHGLAEVRTRESVKGKVVLDIGGYIGDSVLVLAELEPSCIYTFEAVPENFEILKKTMELNHVSNVVAENVALGAQPGTMTIHVAGSGSTGIDRPGLKYNEDICVPVITLDEYVAEHQMEIGLIKVDIEGSEPSFLAGAKQTICSQKPILLLSIYHNAHDFFELKPMIESWNLGYKFKIHKPIYESATGETLLIAEVEAD